MTKILYVAGWGRSGTTLLDNVLGQVEGFVSTGELHNIWQRGLVEPAWVTAGGHARWNVDALKQQVRDLRDHDDE